MSPNIADAADAADAMMLPHAIIYFALLRHVAFAMPATFSYMITSRRFSLAADYCRRHADFAAIAFFAAAFVATLSPC